MQQNDLGYESTLLCRHKEIDRLSRLDMLKYIHITKLQLYTKVYVRFVVLYR